LIIFGKQKTEKMKAKEQEKTEVQKLNVELSIQEWEAVLAVIEQSTSPHIQVKSISAELIKQLQPQIKTDDKS